MSRIDNFKQRARDWGLKRAVYWNVMSVLARVGIHVHYVTVGTDRREIDLEEAIESPPGYESRPVGLDEILTYVDRVPGLVRDHLEVAFGRGDYCIGNFHGGDLVGFAFESWTRARVNDQLDVLVPKGFRYGYKAWTHPDHRRMHLSRLRAYTRRLHLKRPHEERSIGFVETHNYESVLHTYRHPNLRGLRMGLCGWITLLGKQFPFNTRRAKWIGFEMVRKNDDGRRQYV